MSSPSDWVAQGQQAWDAGRRQEAIDAVLAELNSSRPSPPGPFLQLAYYLFTIGDYRAAAVFLSHGAKAHPKDQQIALNLAVCQSRAGDFSAAVESLARYQELGGRDPVAFDSVVRAFYKLGRIAEAKAAGEKALALKDAAAAAGPPAPVLQVPAEAPSRRRIIAFSLFGSNPRYLRGALHNAIRAQSVYPGWTCRFYHDATVPADLLEALGAAKAELVPRDGSQPPHRRLCWRFEAADDPDVGFFLVRDCDSVVTEREAGAVREWLDSGKPFHVMRDWWTHTDTILAGMWGGTAGLLPAVQGMIAGYQAGKMITANWDQWFLGARIWPLIRNSVLVHDRFYRSHASRPLPGEDPPGTRHVGQDEYAVRRNEQAAFLADWAESVPSLGLRT